jgi:hypothetical protein
MAEQITTSDGTEFRVKAWRCPGCGHCQEDSVHPELGPYLSCTCGACGASFDDEALDPDSLTNWLEARDTAEAYGKIHR